MALQNLGTNCYFGSILFDATKLAQMRILITNSTYFNLLFLRRLLPTFTLRALYPHNLWDPPSVLSIIIDLLMNI